MVQPEVQTFEILIDLLTYRPTDRPTDRPTLFIYLFIYLILIYLIFISPNLVFSASQVYTPSYAWMYPLDSLLLKCFYLFGYNLVF